MVAYKATQNLRNESENEAENEAENDFFYATEKVKGVWTHAHSPLGKIERLYLVVGFKFINSPYSTTVAFSSQK